MIAKYLNQLNSIEIIILAAFAISFLVQLIYYLAFFSRIIFKKIKAIDFKNASYPPISVIIAAKNESYNLPENLPAILSQDYPEYQVIVVDDCSEDDTWDVLEGLKKQYPELYTTRIHFDPVFKHGKKMALSLGIKAAKYDILVFTDADCQPASNQWLKHIAQGYQQKDIVLGYSPVLKEPGFLNHFIRYDNLFTAIQYLTMAIANRTYMGVGRNLSYKKQLFFDSKGFSPHIQLMSGDDDLFINKVATAKNVAVALHPEAHVNTKGKRSWKDWIIQKRRHLTTGKFYRFKDKFRLGVELFSRFFFYTSFIASLILLPFNYLILAIFGLRLLAQGLIINLTARKLKQANFLLSFWFLDIMHPVFNLFLYIKNTRSKKKLRWK